MNDKEKKKKRFSKDYIWTFTTYFTEGFPYGMIRSVFFVFFRDMKGSLESIGVLSSLFQLPWTLKFLWGPWVDEYSTKRRWLLTMQTILLVILTAAAFIVPLSNSLLLMAALFFIGSFIAATHDIAIDGYYMEALDQAGQAKFVGYRVMAFRAAWMAGTGGIVTIGAVFGWFMAFLAAAIIFSLFLLYHYFFLKEVESVRRKIKILFLRALHLKPLLYLAGFIVIVMAVRYFFQSPLYSQLEMYFPLLKKIQLAHGVALLLLVVLVLVGVFRKRIKSLFLKDSDSYYGKAFIYFMDRDKIGIILSFIILLRVGEWTLATMVSPFLIDLGVKIHIGWISAGIGLPASIVGAMLGGWMISHFTLKKVLWPFILVQNITNLIYMGLALHLASFIAINTNVAEPVGIGIGNLVLVAATHGFDQFASGLGNAVLMTYLMRICHKEFKAAHYAIGSALMNVSNLFSAPFSGIIAGWLGYAWLFGLSFAASVPAMLLIPFLPYVSDNGERPQRHEGTKE
jgi:PAT family beta-lactamase induction signal transducer AmpG